MHRALSTLSLAILFSIPAFATITVQLTPSLTLPQPVGTPIVWTAAATDDMPGALDYQFSVSTSGEFQVYQDFSPASKITWAPSSKEGNFSLQVIVRNESAGETATLQVPVAITSRVTAGVPVVSATAHPLVALYSAPPCPAGSSIYVVFSVGAAASRTNSRPCSGTTSMNFYIGGMSALTTYLLHHVIQTGGNPMPGPDLSFKTGAIPSNLLFPDVIQAVAPGTAYDARQRVLLADNLGPTLKIRYASSYMPTAYNPAGKVIWYYSGLSPRSQNGAYYIRPLDGGTFMVHLNDPTSAWVINQIWREIDLAGNTLRQTNATRVNEQINAAGYVGCTSFSHDAIRLPNGHTLIVCTQEQIFPAGTQGATAPVDVGGTGVVDLDQNLQLAWYWSAYDHLDVNRAAILGEIITPDLGFVPLVLDTVVNDWLHCNTIDYIPSTGDFLLSLRHQDWIVKISYKNGVGDGTVLWEMGPGGSFAIDSTDPYPWFTHQHDTEYEKGGTNLMTLYDNGNTRSAQNPGVTENSRGMALSIDEANMVVTPVLSQDLGGYSKGGGSAQLLDNGNYHFDSADYTASGEVYSQHPEIQPTSGTNGTFAYNLQIGTDVYRSYRMVSLYQTN